MVNWAANTSDMRQQFRWSGVARWTSPIVSQAAVSRRRLLSVNSSLPTSTLTGKWMTAFRCRKQRRTSTQVELALLVGCLAAAIRHSSPVKGDLRILLLASPRVKARTGFLFLVPKTKRVEKCGEKCVSRHWGSFLFQGRKCAVHSAAKVSKFYMALLWTLYMHTQTVHRKCIRQMVLECGARMYCKR